MPRFRSHRRLRRALALAGAASVVVCALPAAAGAHAYLVHSEPPAAARLASAPSRIVLRFSEAYVAGSERLTLERGDGTDIPLTKPAGRGVLVVQPLPLLRRGVYVATWRVVSDDGHLSAGELAFSIGSAEALPAASASKTPTPWAQIVASWVFFAGLALAFGGLLSERFVLRVAAPRAPAGIAAGLAAVASFVLLILLAGDRAGGGFVAGSHGDALQAVLSTRPGALTFAVLLATAIGALVAEAGALRPLALIPLAAAAILTAVHGHSGTSGHWWAPVVDSIHLLGAAAWAGALAHLVLVVWRAPDRAAARALAIRRYSRLALPTVLVILVSGVLTAFGEFRSAGSAFHSGYGQTLIVKSALVLTVLAVAAASRLLALPANPGIKLPLLRRLTLSEILLLVAVLAAVGLLVNLAPPRTAAAPAAPAVSPLLPGAIPTGPFVDAREDGDLAVGFAAEPAGSGRLKLSTTVIAGDGGRARGLRLSVRLVSASVSRGPAGTCGAGCYAATLAFAGRPRVAFVTIRPPGQASSVVRFDFPSAWPPPSAKQIAREATLVFDRLRTITIDERLGSSVTNVAHTKWRLEAPNKLSYSIEGGPQAVIIGGRRWDRNPGGRWVASPQLPVTQPTPTWGSPPARAALLGDGRVDGREVWRISFVDPTVPAWFNVWIDKKTLRTLKLRMIAPAHFMHHVYAGFDEPQSIGPPR